MSTFLARPRRKPARNARKTAERMTLDTAMQALRGAGSVQARKTYLRHGAPEPVLGVSFAALKTLARRIGTDQELAHALWDTRAFEARILATKVADPGRMTARDLDRWAGPSPFRGCEMYLASLTAEGPHAKAKTRKWLASKDPAVRCAAWALVAQRALRDDAARDAEFAAYVGTIERTIHKAPNAERELMNRTLISIGGRSAALRRKALAAAARIGTVEVDHGDTWCKTPAAAPYIEKMWAHAAAKGFASPAAQERARKPPRLRC